jgi:hypothetical protein
MKITIADQDGVESFGEDFLREFLRDILDQEDALITDESFISDFIEFGLQGAEYEAAKEEIWKRIEDKYQVNVRSEVCILKIFRKIDQATPKGGVS